MQAVLDKDHAKAAAILDELIHDPTPGWDFPERAALLRELREAHKKTDALCAETLKPAVFRHAFLVLQRQCGK
jgi:hypothetical protein